MTVKRVYSVLTWSDALSYIYLCVALLILVLAHSLSSGLYVWVKEKHIARRIYISILKVARRRSLHIEKDNDNYKNKNLKKN